MFLFILANFNEADLAFMSQKAIPQLQRERGVTGGGHLAYYPLEPRGIFDHLKYFF